MLYFNTHKGIIRNSSIDELTRLLKFNFSTLFLLYLTDYTQAFFSGEKIFNDLNIFVTSICCFQGLFFLRIAAKSIYEGVGLKKGDMERTLVVCNNIKSSNAINSILQNTKTKFKPIAIFAMEGVGSGLNQVNIPIYFKQTTNFSALSHLEFDLVLIDNKTLLNVAASDIISECKQKGKRIYSVNTEPQILTQLEPIFELNAIEVCDILNRSEIDVNQNSQNSVIADKTILVTGGAGSIGSEIVRQLIKFKPRSILILDFSETALYNLEMELEEVKNISFQFLLNDINDALSIENIFQKYSPQIVYHAAAYKHVPMMERHPRQSVITNIKASISLAKIATQFKAEKFVYVSSDKAVNPIGVMGICKRISEIYLNAFYSSNIKNNIDSPKFIFTRFGNVLKSNGSVVHRFEEQIKKGGPLTITDPEITRYFMSIEEAACLVLEASFMGKGGEFYVFDMGNPIKIKDLAQNLINLHLANRGNTIKIEYIGLRPGEKMYEELIYDKAKDLPTHHPKIMISKDNPINYHFTNILTLDLLQDLNQLNNTEIKNRLKTLLSKLENIEINASQN